MELLIIFTLKHLVKALVIYPRYEKLTLRGGKIRENILYMGTVGRVIQLPIFFTHKNLVLLATYWASGNDFSVSVVVHFRLPHSLLF